MGLGVLTEFATELARQALVVWWLFPTVAILAVLLTWQRASPAVQRFGPWGVATTAVVALPHLVDSAWEPLAQAAVFAVLIDALVLAVVLAHRPRPAGL